VVVIAKTRPAAQQEPQYDDLLENKRLVTGRRFSKCFSACAV
jgi:hypothetical protein